MAHVVLAEIMQKPIVPILMICLIAGSAAQAQSTGGNRRGGRDRPSPDSAPRSGLAPSHRLTPLDDIEIIGVIQAVEPASDRVTIAYEAVEALNWPAGTKPFTVSRTALLKGATEGEKVRFKLESEQISDLKPF
jgi:Cu/Ag efflux protein CusF